MRCLRNSTVWREMGQYLNYSADFNFESDFGSNGAIGTVRDLLRFCFICKINNLHSYDVFPNPNI